MEKPRVVILGAGFGGLTAAKALAGKAQVTLVDRHNFQTFLPLLYQVATAGLAADHVAYPVRGALRKSDVAFRMGSPLSIDHKNKSVKLDSSEVLEFDHLIVALGSATADFGIKGVKENTLGMKSVNEAIKIRSDIMRRFEDLCRFEDDTVLSISIIGGGPTGVEMAGAIAELVRGPLASDQKHASAHIEIHLIEAGPRVLSDFSLSLSARTQKDLEKLGVKIHCNSPVDEVKSREIILSNGKVISSEVTIWAAGVRGEPAVEQLDLPISSTRIEVEDSLQVKHYPHIWAIGDIAGAKKVAGDYLPMVAPVAMQQGRWVAKQILRLMQGGQAEKFVYKDKGAMATIGRHKAVVEVGKFKFAGGLAWYAWLVLHLFYLLGGRNKVLTVIDWMWNYLTFDRGNRHILDSI